MDYALDFCLAYEKEKTARKLNRILEDTND